VLFPSTYPQYLKGYRLTGNSGSNKANNLKNFMPHDSLKSDEPYKRPPDSQ
jgi:hypothetical protein